MEIIRIFDNLFAFRYDGETKHELQRLFDLWQDVEHLEKFFDDHSDDLQRDFWNNCSVEDAIDRTLRYAKNFLKEIVKLNKETTFERLNTLETLFQPLNDGDYQIIPFHKSKAKNNWLRLYALRADKDVYIITGGAIKLTRTMNERNHTDNELKKMEACREYILNSGIVDSDGLIELVEF